jgi:hypothetical protein
VTSDYLRVRPSDSSRGFTVGDMRRALVRAEALGVSEDEPLLVTCAISFNTNGAPVTAVNLPIRQD